MLGYSRYGIAWRWKGNNAWKLWVYHEYPCSPVAFQYDSCLDDSQPTHCAHCFIKKFIKSDEIETKVVDIEYKVYELIDGGKRGAEAWSDYTEKEKLEKYFKVEL
jgi:hypothetical protein